MTPEKILTIRLGTTATYLVPGKDGYLLIDGGHRVWDRCFFARLKRAGIRPQQVRLAVITHVHCDHVGTLPAVKKHCGCPIAVHARVIPTPGHTEGSLSILTAAGNAFVGDIAVNLPLLGRRRYGSPFGYSPGEMAASLKRLIREGARRIYPAHGRPFDAAEWLEQVPF